MITEKMIEDLIYNAKQSDHIKMGLPEMHYLKRQVNLYGYGIADLVNFNYDIRENEEGEEEEYVNSIDVIELKKGKIDAAAIGQVIKYAKGLSVIYPDVKINMYVIGTSWDECDLIYSSSVFDNLHFKIMELTPKGVCFRDATVSLIDSEIPKEIFDWGIEGHK